jgi:hypothetical protein
MSNTGALKNYFGRALRETGNALKLNGGVEVR